MKSEAASNGREEIVGSSSVELADGRIVGTGLPQLDRVIGGFESSKIILLDFLGFGALY